MLGAEADRAAASPHGTLLSAAETDGGNDCNRTRVILTSRPVDVSSSGPRWVRDHRHSRLSCAPCDSDAAELPGAGAAEFRAESGATGCTLPNGGRAKTKTLARGHRSIPK